MLGEVALVIGAGDPIEKTAEKGKAIKGIANQLAAQWGISKREAYNLLMKIKPE